MGEAEREYLKIWLSHAVIGAAATVAVGLRFWARNRTGAKLKLDDHLIVLTALLMWGDFICTILEYRPYLNRVPPDELNVKDHSDLKLYAFISIFMTAGCEVAARISLVFLYYRLFSVKRWLGWSLKIVAALSIIWLLIVIFAITFQCKPIAAVVDASVKGECLDAQFGFLVTEAINLGLDMALVLLPIKTIWGLHLPTRERIGIILIFMTGSLVMITQILRMIFGYNPDGEDRSVTSLAQLSLWTGLHLGFAIICACLPVFRVYLPKEDGALNTRLRLLYRNVSGWVSRTSRSESQPSRPTLHLSVPTYRKRAFSQGKSPSLEDGIPLKTQTSTISVEMLGASEYHRRDF